MNNAPVVYVPTTPEGDGLTLPTVLSVLAHAIVIGILIYHYQHLPEPEGSIETVMVTPEELAEIQGQILANRAAASNASGEDNLPSGAVSQAPPNANNSINPITSQRVPVFTQSNDAAMSNDRPILMSQEQHEQLLEQSQSYNEALSDWSAQQDGVATERLEEVENSRREEQLEERDRLKSYQNRQNNPPKIERPNGAQRNIEISSGGSGSGGKSFSLSDGQSTFSGDSSSTSSPTTGRSKSAGGSRGASNSEIINLIRRNYSPPIAAKGSTQRATLSITVNASGDVVNVSASGSDSAVNEAARQAVLSTRNLPIDPDDPKYPTFTIQFNGSN